MSNLYLKIAVQTLVYVYRCVMYDIDKCVMYDIDNLASYVTGRMGLFSLTHNQIRCYIFPRNQVVYQEYSRSGLSQ